MGWMKIAGRAAFSAGALLLAACTTTVRMPASELPALAPATRPEPVQWATVYHGEGEKKTLKGPIEEVRLDMKQGGSVPLYLPMDARVEGDQLTVAGPLGPRAFRMQDISMVQVEYYDKEKQYKITGGTLIGASSPFLVTGTVALGAALTDLDSAYGGIFALFGFASTSVGLGMAIPGMVLLMMDPKPPGAETAALRPKFDVGPGGVRFSTTF
jgi:hypothetical protein